MNQRLKRKIEKRRRQKICEALDLCLQINGLQKSKRKLTGNHPTAFCDFGGHTAWISAKIHVKGWETGQNPDEELRAYITRPNELDKMIRELKELKKNLHSGNCNRPRH